MVKSYARYEQSHLFGVISSNTNIVWVRPPPKTSSAGSVITGSLEQVAQWDIKTGEKLKTLQNGLPVGASDASTTKPADSTAIQYHADTSLCAVGYADGSIMVWDLFSKTVLMTLNGHKSAVTILQFDSTGTRLISGSRDSNIIVWDLVGEVGLYKLRSHKDAITGIWSNEEWLISVSKDGLIKVWDLKVQQCVETHVAHAGECWSLAVEDDLCITAGSETQLKCWKLDLDAETKLVEQGVLEKQSKNRGLEISFTTVAENRFFMVTNADKTVEIFRLRTPEEISKGLKKREKRLREKGMSDAEILQHVTDNHVSILIQPLTVVRSQFKIRSANWAHVTANKLNIVLSTSSNTIEYYNFAYTKKEAQPANKQYTVDLPGHRTDVRALDLSQDDLLLASASNGQLKIWNTKSYNCIRSFECGYALCCRFLPGGSLVVVGTRQGELQLYDLASSTLLDSQVAHEGAVWSVDMVANGTKLVTGSADKTVKFWKIEVQDGSLKLVHETSLEMNEDVLAVKISPEDKFLCVSLLDNTVKVFFLDSMKFYLSLYGHKLPVLSMDISYDSKMIITSSADKNIKVWGLDFGDCHRSLFAHQDSIMSVRFLPDSHNFFSASKDGNVKYWDGDKFECIQKLSAHQSEVWALAVASSGEFVVSTSHDHSIRIWSETDDQVFLEEEKEKEMDELYQETLLSSLEDDPTAPKGDDSDAEDDSATAVTKQTIETLKAGEKLMEALDIGIEDIDQMKSETPQRNAILMALNKTGIEYIMDTLSKIRPAQMDDALLVMPFSYVLKFLTFIDHATKDREMMKRYLQLLCRTLFFIIKTHHRELVAQKNEELKLQIIRCKDAIKTKLTGDVNEMGFNIQGLKFVKQQWDLKHKFEFVDEYEQREQDAKTSKKRVFA